MKCQARLRGVALACLLLPSAVRASEREAEAKPEISAAVTGYYYAMRDQPDFGVGVASFNRGSLHLEARYNYEAHNATSLFAGWRFTSGGDVVFEATPMVGTLFGSTRGIVPGLEASIAYHAFDAYVEAEYVHNLADGNASYYYAWTELGWKPAEWLRVGFAAQRTQTVDSGRDVQPGVFVQLTWGKTTFGVYGFNPDMASRYFIVSVGSQF
jgi:hypothetical protein